jgi:hypothetical protein
MLLALIASEVADAVSTAPRSRFRPRGNCNDSEDDDGRDGLVVVVLVEDLLVLSDDIVFAQKRKRHRREAKRVWRRARLGGLEWDGAFGGLLAPRATTWWQVAGARRRMRSETRLKPKERYDDTQ